MFGVHAQRVLLLTVTVAMVGCAESQPTQSCDLEIEQVIELPRGQLCDITPTGLILRQDPKRQGYVIEQLGASGELVELTRVEYAGFWCGAIAQDLESGRIWLSVPGNYPVQTELDRAHTLLELDADGQLLTSELLLHEAKPIEVSSLLVREGELFIAGRLYDEDAPVTEFGHPARALLERRDAAGQTVWRQLGFVGFNPQLAEEPFNGFGELVAHELGVSGFAAIFGIDSQMITMLTIRATSGEVDWVDLVTPDNYEGPYAKLASDGARALFIAEERSPILEYDVDTWTVVGVLQPARSIVSGYSTSGWTLWRSEVEWPGWGEIDVSNPVVGGDKVYTAVYGMSSGQEPKHHVALTQLDRLGALDCQASLDPLDLREARTLRWLGDDRLVLGAVGAPPDDPDAGSYGPPVIVQLRMRDAAMR